MNAMASQITSLTIVCSTVYSGTDQRKHQSSTSLAFVRGIHRWPLNSPHKGPVTQKMCPFDDVMMYVFIIPWGISARCSCDENVNLIGFSMPAPMYAVWDQLWILNLSRSAGSRLFYIRVHTPMQKMWMCAFDINWRSLIMMFQVSKQQNKKKFGAC